MWTTYRHEFSPNYRRHHLPNMQFCHLLTRSVLTRTEVCLTVSLGSSVFWSSCLVFSVICYSAFCLHVATSFLCIPIFCPKLGLCLVLLQSLCLFIIFPSVSCCFSHVFHLCCCYSSCVSWFTGPI